MKKKDAPRRQTKKPDAPRSPGADKTLSDQEVEIMNALNGVTLALEVSAIFKRILLKALGDSPVECEIGNRDPQSHYNCLADFESLLILALVWVNSYEFIEDRHLRRVELKRDFKSAIVTLARLAEAHQECECRDLTSKSTNMYSRRVQRVIQAALAFGLIKKINIRSNYKPLIPTKRLHDIMVEVGCELTVNAHATFHNK